MRYEIEATPSRIEARISERLKYDNQEQADFRRELASRIAGFSVGDDEMLHATYCGPENPRLEHFDVENVLFYNVGDGCFSHAARNGVSFAFNQHAERRMTYEVIPFGRGPEGALLIEQSDIPIGQVNSETAAWQVWLWLHQWLDKHPQQAVDWGGRTFAMKIGLGGVAGNFAAYIKRIFDGVIATFHRCKTAPMAFTEGVAARIGCEENAVRRWVKRGGLLTVSDRLPSSPRDKRTPCSPDDHLCTFGALHPLPMAGRVMHLRVWSV